VNQLSNKHNLAADTRHARRRNRYANNASFKSVEMKTA